ncbi:MAG: hypothetical protein AAB250_09180, partial [Bdellovibrionota bacterium]
TGSCYPFRIQALSSSNTPARIDYGGITVSVNASGNVLSNSPDCSSPTNALSVSSFEYSKHVFVKLLADGNEDISISGGTLTSTSFYVVGTTSQPAAQMKLYSQQTTFKQYECVPMKLAMTNANVPATEANPLVISLSGDADWKFYPGSDSSCTPGSEVTSSNPVSGVQTTDFFWVRYLGAPGTISYTPDALDPDGGTRVANTFTVNAHANASAVKLVDVPQYATAGECQSLSLEVRDSSDQSSRFLPAQLVNSNSMDVTVTGTGVEFFSTGCPGSVVGSKTVQIYKYLSRNSGMVSWRPVSTTFSLTATPNNADLVGLTLSSTTENATATPAVATQVVGFGPGDTYTNGDFGTSSAPAPNNQTDNVSFPITLKALTNYNTLADGSNGSQAFNGTISFTSSNSFLTFPSGPTATFSNGVATLNVKIDVLSPPTTEYLSLQVISAGSQSVMSSEGIPIVP